MHDVHELSRKDRDEIAAYIREDTLEYVNRHVKAANVKTSFYTKYGKRAIDIVLSALAVIFTAPVNLILAAATYFDVGRPIIFKQKRTGKDKKPFTIYKFRNMTNATDAHGELLPSSMRVTKWGKFVRRTSLDELMNFISILNGSMSFIGPRPLVDSYKERLNNRHLAMYAVKPGLECPTPERIDHNITWQERLDNYVWYAENCSLLVDIKLCFRMISLVFDKRETKRRSEVTNGGFLGYDRDGNVIYTRSVPDKYIEQFCRAHGYKDLKEAIDRRSK